MGEGQLVQPEFVGFPKIPRLNREVIYTEKIDGSNGAIVIEPDGEIFIQSRKRFILPGKTTDNHGFAGWVYEHADQLIATLGPGRHFGEWYGRGIQRGYGIKQGQGWNGKFFALFNTSRWTDEVSHAPCTALGRVPGLTTVPVLGGAPSLVALGTRKVVHGDPPAGCEYETVSFVETILDSLRRHGSFATGADGFTNPEGVIIFHAQGNVLFKVTLENDERPKGAPKSA